MIEKTSRSRICLVSPGHVASNPRLVKEANALYETGYLVRVVVGDYMAAVRPLDQTLLSTAPWSWTKVNLGSRFGYGLRRLRQEGAKCLAKRGLSSSSLATWAHSPMSSRLGKAAASEPADLYIAHCLAALPAAAYAADKHNAKLGFDAEDSHVGELLDIKENQTEIVVRDCIERNFLSRCHHLTAASPKIAEFYADRYGVKMRPILNVFSRSDCNKKGCSNSQESNSRDESVARPHSLYWFSQTIGPGRGLETIVKAMGRMKEKVQLCLRGFISDEYRHQLLQLSQTVGLDDQIVFFPSASPSQMVNLASSHDVGLSLELSTPLNRDICLTNKIFTYIIAGLPLLLSKTTAQIEIAKDLGEIAMLVDLDNPDDVASTLDAVFSNPARLARMKAAALCIGQSQYNWDIEKTKFLKSVEELLS